MKAKTFGIDIIVNYRITLWDAVKLRLAGSNYRYIADELLGRLKKQSGLCDCSHD